MDNPIHPSASVIVIFGGGGDLTWRKLVPALYDLAAQQRLPEQFAILGIDQKPMTDEAFRQHLRQGVEQFSRFGIADDAAWGRFASNLVYLQGEFSDEAVYSQLSARLAAQDKTWRSEARHIFYLAVPPMLIETIVHQLEHARLSHDRKRARIVVEKPFGRSLESARALNKILSQAFDESQIYRIDHYLGKETVQNILAFRFANAFFEPIWDRRYIDHVQIAVAEQVGVEHRGGYYDHAGALRDMVQNHLLQLLALIAMEPPVSFTADEIRNKKLDTLCAIRPIAAGEIHRYAVRGQYGAGWLHGERVPAYRNEPDVNPDSSTETFAAVKLYVDNWRWQGVPFYLRTGKRLPVRSSQISIHFLPVPHQSFPAAAIESWQQPNRLVVNVQPQEGIVLRFQAKQPGLNMHLSPVDMRFGYAETFKSHPPEAYETLLLDVMLGDATLFMRVDQVEAAWSVVDPILDVWNSAPAGDFPNYAANTWGPEAAVALIARDGRSWLPIANPDEQAP